MVDSFLFSFLLPPMQRMKQVEREESTLSDREKRGREIREDGEERMFVKGSKRTSSVDDFVSFPESESSS